MAAVASHDPAGVLGGHAPAPQRPALRPPRHPHEQFLQSQAFYPPAVQPFFPYQWPMSSLCVPYGGGLHGLGYGMMPLLLPPCLEVPGGMIPQAQLHMVDYRRMNPHVVPTAAHQAHFQTSVPHGRVMVSSEVQTEPICHSIDSHGHAERSDTCSESGRGSTVSTSPRCPDNKSTACPEGSPMLTQNYNGTNAVGTTLSVGPKSEIFQTERMQIQFREMPSEPDIIQNKEDTELASYDETELLQCSLGSVQSSEDVVVCSYKSLAIGKDKRTVEAGMLRYSRKCNLTDVNLVKTSPSCKTFKTCQKPGRPQSVNTKKTSEMLPKPKGKEDSPGIHFKILRLPFELSHKQPCQFEASLWSVESLLPYVPSNEWMTKNSHLTPGKFLKPLIEPNDVISKLNIVPTEKNLTKCRPHHLDASVWSVESLMPYVPSSEWMVENGLLTPRKPLRPQNKSCDALSELNLSACSTVGRKRRTATLTKSHGRPCQLEASVWSVESLMPYVPSSEWLNEKRVLISQKPVSSQIKFSDVLSKPNKSSTDEIPVGKSLQTSAASTKCKDSLETCSPYRPSSSWLADFGNVYYYSKLPVGRQQSDNLENRQQKLSLAIGPESSPLRNGRKTRKQRSALCITDQKQCSSDSCKCNAQSSPRLAGSVIIPGWVSPSTPKCPSCRYDMKGKDHKKQCISAGLCCEREQKNVDGQRSKGGVRDIKKMPMGGHLSESYQGKLREQAGLCEFCPCRRASPARGNVSRCGDLGCVWEKSEEGQNLVNQIKRLRKDNTCKGVRVSNTERNILKNEREGHFPGFILEGDS